MNPRYRRPMGTNLMWTADLYMDGGWRQVGFVQEVSDGEWIAKRPDGNVLKDDEGHARTFLSRREATQALGQQA